MKCIYCKTDTSRSQGVEHVIPEALGCQKTLEKGSMCDECNNYFSAMDNNFLLNRFVALYFGAKQIPGKSGVRKQIANRLRFSDYGSFELELVSDSGKADSRKLVFKPRQDRSFDELLFARGVHKIAFNSFAYRHGLQDALHERFDRLRRYVRQPENGEIWNYAVRQAPSDENYYATFYTQSREIVELHILCLDFCVVLTGWRRDVEERIAGDNVFIVSRKGNWQDPSVFGLKR
jgi:HNH endonuclease